MRQCWKSRRREYRSRITECRPASLHGSAVYVCDGQPANEVTATYFATDPPTAIAERGDEVSLMYQQPAASGAKYQGRNEMIWEHQSPSENVPFAIMALRVCG